MAGDGPSWADLDRVDLTAIADVIGSLSPSARERLGAGVARIGSATLVSVAAEPSPFLNRALGIGSGDPATAPEIDAVADHFRGLEVRSFGVLLNDLAQPVDALPEWLAEAGFRRGPGSPKLWCRPVADGAFPSPFGASEAEVVVTTDADLVAELSVRGFGWGDHMRDWYVGPVGRAGWTHYVARVGSEPVGVAAMRVEDGVAWLGFGATRPEARGRGVQGALIRRRIADASAAGCSDLVSETADAPNPSLRNLVGHGFRAVHHRTNWVTGP